MRIWTLLLAVACWSVQASAQAPDVQAAALFDQGIEQMRSHDYARACPALAESVRLDCRPGALFTLADCEAEWGKVASAVAHYREYLELYESLPDKDKTAQAERAQAARAAVGELEPAVPTLTLRLSSRAAPGASVELDGSELGAASLGVPLPLDPGDHRVIVRAPSHADRSLTVALARNDKRVETIDAGPPVPSAKPPPKTATAPKGKPIEPSRRTSPMTYVALAVGAAGLTVGAATGILAFSEKSKVDDNCHGVDCNQSGLDAADRGKRYALVSTVAFAIGAAGVGTAAVLFIGSGSRADARRSYGAAWTHAF